MERKTIVACFVVSLVLVMLALMSSIPVAMAIPGQLSLETIPPGGYVGDSDDDWLHESTVTTDTSFDLLINNHQGKDIYHLYLLVAVNITPAGNVAVYVSNSLVDPYDGVITTNNNALVTETDPDYEYPGHGVYNYGSSTHFEVIELTIPDDGILSAGETITVPIEINLINPVKVHFDAVGADSTYDAISFVPPSHDVTYTVPEFATIALPIAAILGLLFFFNRRTRRKE